MSIIQTTQQAQFDEFSKPSASNCWVWTNFDWVSQTRINFEWIMKWFIMTRITAQQLPTQFSNFAKLYFNMESITFQLSASMILSSALRQKCLKVNISMSNLYKVRFDCRWNVLFNLRWEGVLWYRLIVISWLVDDVTAIGFLRCNGQCPAPPPPHPHPHPWIETGSFIFQQYHSSHPFIEILSFISFIQTYFVSEIAK